MKQGQRHECNELGMTQHELGRRSACYSNLILDPRIFVREISEKRVSPVKGNAGVAEAARLGGEWVHAEFLQISRQGVLVLDLLPVPAPFQTCKSLESALLISSAMSPSSRHCCLNFELSILLELQ